MSEELLELTDVCEKYFGLKPRVARHKAALGTLPVPAFRLANANRGPLFIRKSDLDALAESRAEAAKALSEKMKLVAAA